MSDRVDIAIIGGSGVTRVLDDPLPHPIITAYGEATVQIGGLAGQRVAFLPRHGEGHRVPPHRIDYRANIAALNEITDRILATAAVGGLDPDLEPGTFVLIDQFLDHTHGRRSTFFDDQVAHVDVTAPYCSQLRSILTSTASSTGIVARDGGTYVCTQGPRFESAAEVRAFRMLGGDVVGMTGVPEVVLARELGLCYASVASVTNTAAGLRDEPLTHEEVLEVQASNADRLLTLLRGAIAELPAERTCTCGRRPEPM